MRLIPFALAVILAGCNKSPAPPVTAQPRSQVDTPTVPIAGSAGPKVTDDEIDQDGVILHRKTVEFQHELVGATAQFGPRRSSGGDPQSWLVGVVENRRSTPLRSVGIDFAIFNAKGDRIGSLSSTIRDLGPGKRWNFKTDSLPTLAYGLKQEFIRFTISE